MRQSYLIEGCMLTHTAFFIGSSKILP
jgi:hypothetical protein